MARAGMNRILVVLPQEQATDLKHCEFDLDIQIEFTTWGNKADISFEIDQPSLLVMGHSVHHHSSLSTLTRANLQGADLVAQISDLAHCENDRRNTAGGGAAFNHIKLSATQISSGAFLCSPGLFSSSTLIAKSVDIWTFIDQCLIDKSTRNEEIPPHLWSLATDKQGARAARKMLFDQVSKSTSGTVARLINVRISVPFSKVIVDTGISPNMVTFFLVLCPGLLGAYLVTRPDDYLRIVLAGGLWQLASILDGCDGEIARVKLGETKFGAWFDTVTDNFAYICGYICMILGMQWLYPDAHFALFAGISAIASMILTLCLLYLYALRTNTGSLQYYLGDLAHKVPEREKDWSYRLLERFGFVAKRDFLSLFIAIGMVANQFEAIYWLLTGLVHLSTLAVLTTHYRLIKVQEGDAASEMQSQAIPTRPTAVNREEIA